MTPVTCGRLVTGRHTPVGVTLGWIGHGRGRPVVTGRRAEHDAVIGSGPHGTHSPLSLHSQSRSLRAPPPPSCTTSVFPSIRAPIPSYPRPLPSPEPVPHYLHNVCTYIEHNHLTASFSAPCSPFLRALFLFSSRPVFCSFQLP